MSENVNYTGDPSKCAICMIPFSRTSGDMYIKSKDTEYKFSMMGDFRDRRLTGNVWRVWICPNCAKMLRERMDAERDMGRTIKRVIDYAENINKDAADVIRGVFKDSIIPNENH